MTYSQQSTASENSVQKLSASLALSPERSEGLNYLEHLTAQAGKKCPNPKCPTLSAKDIDAKKMMYMRANCKQWACKVCGYKNAMRWIARMLHATTQLDGLWSFVTLTAHSKWRGRASLKNIRSNWPKLRKRFMRLVPEGTHYIWVLETHADGSWHVHMLTNWQLETKWWKDNAAQCGMGYMSKAINLDNVGQAAGYMAKYLGKQLKQGKKWPKDVRRVTTSQGFPELPKMSTIPDTFVFEPMYDIAHVEIDAAWHRKMNYDVVGDAYVIDQMRKYASIVVMNK